MSAADGVLNRPLAKALHDGYHAQPGRGSSSSAICGGIVGTLTSTTSGVLFGAVCVGLYSASIFSPFEIMTLVGFAIVLITMLKRCSRAQLGVVTTEEAHAGPKFKVAIAGSGLAGLGLANVLTEAGFDVTIFEAGAGAGLASRGKLELPNGRFVDVPLRMISPAFYTSLFPMLKELECPHKEIPTDWNLLSPSGDIIFKSALLDFTFFARVRSMCEWFLNGHLFEFFHMFWVLFFHAPRDDETISAYLIRTGIESDPPGQWVEVRRMWLSWMLSITSKQVDTYPASSIRTLAKQTLKLNNQLYRVFPGVWELERRLMKILKTDAVKANYAVGPLPTGSGPHVINGEEFHAVAIATPPNAVECILGSERVASKEWADIFSRFEYKPGKIIVHDNLDAGLPKDPKDWRVMNMQMPETGDESVILSIWLNRFYGWDEEQTDEDAEGKQEQTNYFASWTTDVKWLDENFENYSGYKSEVTLGRAVFTPDTVEAHKRISEIQGTDNIFVCGAYSVPGVGLLEHALQSVHCVVQPLIDARRRWRAENEKPK